MKAPNPREDLDHFVGSLMGIENPPENMLVIQKDYRPEPLLYTADGAPLVIPKRIGLNS